MATVIPVAHAPAPLPSPRGPTSMAVEQLSSSTYERTTEDKNNTSVGRHSATENKFINCLVFTWKALFLPVMGLVYLIFCYICHYKLVKVGGTEDSISNLSTVKSGVTTLSIIYVSVSLLPLSSLINDLKSEEFFRVLALRDQGAALSAINSVSTPSYGMRSSLVNLYRRQCTKYFAGAFVAGLIFLVASALVPAVLSVDTVLFDGDITAFSVGAVSQDSVLFVSNASLLPAVPSAASEQSKESGSVAWAEVTLGVNYSFQFPFDEQTSYIVPLPIDLPINTSARWLSDIVAMHPRCKWIAPQFLNMSANFSEMGSSFDERFTMTLPSTDVYDAAVINNFLDPLDVEQQQSNWSFGSLSEITNGATAWLFTQCLVGCSLGLPGTVNAGLGSGVPTSPYNSTDGTSVDISFLYCEPNAEIQTRRVHSDGKGSLILGETVPQAQGNLHPGQTNLLLSYLFNGFGEAGPVVTSNASTGLGNEAQFSFIFGNDVDMTSADITITPQSIEDITKSYSRFTQSAAKKFVDGSLGSAYVPGRVTRKITVFTTSLPHIIVSTVLYTVLSIFVVACYFRGKAPQFTFLAVAASLAGSNIPLLSSQLRRSDRGSGQDDDEMAETLGNPRVVQEDDEDGYGILHLRGGIPLGRLDGNSSGSNL